MRWSLVRNSSGLQLTQFLQILHLKELILSGASVLIMISSMFGVMFVFGLLISTSLESFEFFCLRSSDCFDNSIERIQESQVSINSDSNF